MAPSLSALAAERQRGGRFLRRAATAAFGLPRRSLWYQGNMFVLRRYAGNSLAHFIQCARKFAIGVLLCLRGELSLTLFLKSSFGALPPKARDLALWAADP
jgi:hypothetical protein